MRYLLAAACVGLAAFATAQSAPPRLPLTAETSWPGTERYDPAVPTPEQVIGHRIGSRHTDPAQVVRYFEAVAAASERVSLFQHGRTHEGRPLIHAIVTTPERQSQLDSLQRQHRRLFTAPESFSASELGAMPAVAYLGYSIHGNEASGTEASLLTLYHLAAGEGPAVDSALANVVTLIDPLFNPDGRNRFVDWANQNRGAVANADPQDREHNEPWPGGRTNHYWFDLNRDWLPAQHPESQARLELYYRWRPQVLLDYHEMGSDATFFFQPGIPSRTNPLTPPGNQELTGRITDYSARALDRIGSLYFTRESYDDFYYGKGSTYPDINGAIGILFEQASSRALLREVPAGTLDYGFTVRNQLTASLATVQAISELRGTLLQNSLDFYGGSAAYASTLAVSDYVIPLRGQSVRAAELANLLRRHRVDVYDLSEATELEGERYGPGEAIVIPTQQRQARLLHAIMEPVAEFDDSLFYDVSTWSLPLAFDLRIIRSTGLAVGARGAALDTVIAAGELIGASDSAYAYVIPWESYAAPRVAYRLLAAGGQARVMQNPAGVVVGGESYTAPRGSLVVPLLQNTIAPDSVRAVVERAVATDGVRAYAVRSGLTPFGPDLGGRSLTLLTEPKVALLTGEGTSPYQAGEAWHLLSERVGMPVSLLDVDQLPRADLSRYTTLAMTGGNYPDLDPGLLQDWVKAGGRLIASHTAANWAVDNDLVALEEDTLALDSVFVDLPYAQLDEARGAQEIGGAILRATLDTTHPVAYGLSPKLPLLRQQERFFWPSETPGANVGTYSDTAALASGYISRERGERLGGRAAIVAERLGRGEIILFFDDPVFRSFWRGSERAWLNAVVLEW